MYISVKTVNNDHLLTQFCSYPIRRRADSNDVFGFAVVRIVLEL